MIGTIDNILAMKSVTTWENFKFQIRFEDQKHFEIKKSYTITFAKIGHGHGKCTQKNLWIV